MAMDFEAMRKRMEEIQKVFGAQKHATVPIFDDAPCYPVEELVALSKLSGAICFGAATENRDALIQEFEARVARLQKKPDAPERIYLWPDGPLPQCTDYTENPGFRFNHDPDFRPYMFALLVPEAVTPKGAIVVVPGGDQGDTTLKEGYQVCLSLNALGYQCFLLHNRVNHNPWSGQECGVDVARAIRMLRRDAAKYRIAPDHVAFAGFSNGGLTGEACIQYFSGDQTVADHFPGYRPDELDAFPGAPDAFLCVYGPRIKGTPFDYTRVVYPPTFFAVGRLDGAMDNLHEVYPQLIEHGVPVEVHTFAGTPHGMAGIELQLGESPYPNFQLWLPLADAFLEDVYRKEPKPIRYF